MTISLRIKDEESQLIKAYAKTPQPKPVRIYSSEPFLKELKTNLIFTRTKRQKQEYEKDPHTFTLDEVETRAWPEIMYEVLFSKAALKTTEKN